MDSHGASIAVYVLYGAFVDVQMAISWTSDGSFMDFRGSMVVRALSWYFHGTVVDSHGAFTEFRGAFMSVYAYSRCFFMEFVHGAFMVVCVFSWYLHGTFVVLLFCFHGASMDSHSASAFIHGEYMGHFLWTT